MMTEWELQAAWDGLVRTGEHHTVDLDPALPLRMVIGAKERMPFFLVISSSEPAPVALSSAVHVERRRRETDGMWALHLALLDPDLRPAFMKFCAGLASRAGEQSDEQGGLRAIYRAVDEFRRLLALGHSKVSSEQELKGILAELWLCRHLTRQLGESQALDAWQGPYGAPKDFLRRTSIAHEVKAVGPQAKVVRISSAEQLELDDLAEILVEVFTVTSASDGVTVGEAVASLDNAFSPGRLPQYHDLIARRMTLSDLQDERRFALVRRRTYRIDGTFAAIRPTAIDPAIQHVEYEIILSAMSDRLLDDAKLEGNGWT